MKGCRRPVRVFPFFGGRRAASRIVFAGQMAGDARSPRNYRIGECPDKLREKNTEKAAIIGRISIADYGEAKVRETTHPPASRRFFRRGELGHEFFLRHYLSRPTRPCHSALPYLTTQPPAAALSVHRSTPLPTTHRRRQSNNVGLDEAAARHPLAMETRRNCDPIASVAGGTMLVASFTFNARDDAFEKEESGSLTFSPSSLSCY